MNDAGAELRADIALARIVCPSMAARKWVGVIPVHPGCRRIAFQVAALITHGITVRDVAAIEAHNGPKEPARKWPAMHN